MSLKDWQNNGQGEILVTGEKLPHSHYVNKKSHTDWTQAFSTKRPTNHLSYTTDRKVSWNKLYNESTWYWHVLYEEM
jgi:hypothetical protein